MHAPATVQPSLAFAAAAAQRRGRTWPRRAAELAACLLLGLSRPDGAWAAPPALPFVACPTDGMSGPVPPPGAPPATPHVPASAVERLAIYASAGLAVLAPRGWHCIELYGSGGAFLLATPRLYTAGTLPDFNRLAGPAVELSFLNGENSGREQVAEVVSRLFPSRRRFLREAAEAYGEAPRPFRGPYPADRTVRRSRAVVDYTTPPHRRGMGTFNSRLGPGAAPIFGTARLARSNGVDSIVLLNARLPPGLRTLAPVILRSADVSAWTSRRP